MKSYVTVILISALLLATLFFALPKTENLLFNRDDSFNLNKKEDQYWKKEFTLELDISPKDRALKKQQINKTKDILYKRLKKVGVEEIQIIEKEMGDNPEKAHLKVLIQTSKDEGLVYQLISSTGHVKIMTPKPEEESEEEEEENPLKLYLEENYDETEWKGEKFRTILINDLQTSEGQKSFFAIFKPKFTTKGDFTKFLESHKNETIGVYIAGFVRPILVQDQSIKVFAIPLTEDKGEAQLYDIIFNTGTIPVDFRIIEENELETEIYNINHTQAMLAILASIISLLAFLYQREKENKTKILQLAFSLLLIFSISFTILKIWQVPVDLFLLIPAGILTTVFMKTMYTCIYENKSIILFTTALSILMVTYGTGYIPILGKYILFVILISFLTEILTKNYFQHIKILTK